MKPLLPGLVGAALLLAGSAGADPPASSSGATLSPTRRFSEQTGAALYVNVCQACHMSAGEGAIGAGRYPALAKNEKLSSGGYVLYLVLNGQKAMPPFARLMSDEQVAAVTNYVRSHFGNDYPDPVTADDVKNVR
jgi:mono/diheme cytochrome c family protein